MKKYTTIENIGYTLVVYVMVCAAATAFLLLYKGLCLVAGINP